MRVETVPEMCVCVSQNFSNKKFQKSSFQVYIKFQNFKPQKKTDQSTNGTASNTPS